MRNIPGFSKYLVSENGEIFRYGRQIRLQTDKDGYLRANITNDDGVRRGIAAHTAVALAYIGPAPSSRHEVCHNDGVRDHNQPENLRWDTRKGNHADLKHHGTSVSGTRNGRAKLTDRAVADIRKACVIRPGKKRVQKGIVADLARRYGVDRNTIHRANNGETW